jgi:hypothetical protein
MNLKKPLVGEQICKEWRSRLKGQELPIVRVAWMDAATNQDGKAVEEVMQKPMDLGFVQVSVGYLVKNDRDFVVLGRDWLAEGRDMGFRSWLQVPAGWVLEMKELGYAKEVEDKSAKGRKQAGAKKKARHQATQRKPARKAA